MDVLPGQRQLEGKGTVAICSHLQGHRLLTLAAGARCMCLAGPSGMSRVYSSSGRRSDGVGTLVLRCSVVVALGGPLNFRVV